MKNGMGKSTPGMGRKMSMGPKAGMGKKIKGFGSKLGGMAKGGMKIDSPACKK